MSLVLDLLNLRKLKNYFMKQRLEKKMWKWLAYQDNTMEVDESIWVRAMVKGQPKGESHLRLSIIKRIEAFTNSLSLSEGIQKQIN